MGHRKLEKGRDVPKVIEKVSGDNKENPPRMSLLRQEPLTGFQQKEKRALKEEWVLTEFISPHRKVIN